jgi:hypothetical protein
MKDESAVQYLAPHLAQMIVCIFRLIDICEREFPPAS